MANESKRENEGEQENLFVVFEFFQGENTLVCFWLIIFANNFRKPDVKEMKRKKIFQLVHINGKEDWEERNASHYYRYDMENNSR